jgi:uncharacterized protein (DUF2236 family)
MTVAQRVNAERLALLGWSRAILLQLAHPLVAAGVDEHSRFRAGRMAPILRLHHTIRAMLALTFGDAGTRAEAVAAIRGIHTRVHGTLAASTGRYPAGTPYRADDPALLLWVHATLLESIPLVYQRVVAPLTGAERDDYCSQAADIAVALGATSEDVPRTWAALQLYLDAKYASGDIVVGVQAREVARRVLAPPLPAVVTPLLAVNQLVTIGLLPPHLREQYGLEWSATQERRLHRLQNVLRVGRRWLPQPIVWWPEARRVPLR